jgi:hypothetical protein
VHAVTRCNPTGTLLVVIQSCGLYQYCEDGACHTQVCSPNSFYCAERELRHCDENGASYVVEQMCNGQERCDADAMDCVTDCRPEGCSCTMGFAPCCMANGACGCAIQGLGCNATFATGNERCFCP